MGVGFGKVTRSQKRKGRRGVTTSSQTDLRGRRCGEIRGHPNSQG